MAKFSRVSQSRLDTCDPRLKSIFEDVVKVFDCSILEGHRERDRQNQMVREGKSQTPWPKSKHNPVPSLAVDACPYPVDWEDRERLTLFAGFVLGVAYKHGVTLRWGGDWDRDWQVKDNGFDDLVHFEIV